MQGRRPLPVALKLLLGNPGHRPIQGVQTLMPAMKTPPAPDHLDPVARDKWDELAPDLYVAGVLQPRDGPILETYCQVYARWVEAERKIRKAKDEGHLGVIIKTPNGYPAISPWLVISNKCVEQLRALAVELGLTPSARARVLGGGGQVPLFPEDDPMEALLRAHERASA